MKPTLAEFIDYTSLRPEATADDIAKLCEQAIESGYAAVCVNGIWVRLAQKRLANTSVRVAAVVAFPLGAISILGKVTEATHLIDCGADEIDMVVSLGHVFAGDVDYVAEEVEAVVTAVEGKLVKVILETAALNSEQIVEAASAAKRAGAGMVKTSTGFHPAGGATAESVKLLRSVVGDGWGVKAAGGIRDVKTAWQMIEAGATRIGTSARLG